jgi:hypothetical protein
MLAARNVRGTTLILGRQPSADKSHFRGWGIMPYDGAVPSWAWKFGPLPDTIEGTWDVNRAVGDLMAEEAMAYDRVFQFLLAKNPISIFQAVLATDAGETEFQYCHAIWRLPTRTVIIDEHGSTTGELPDRGFVPAKAGLLLPAPVRSALNELMGPAGFDARKIVGVARVRDERGDIYSVEFIMQAAGLCDVNWRFYPWDEKRRINTASSRDTEVVA